MADPFPKKLAARISESLDRTGESSPVLLVVFDSNRFLLCCVSYTKPKSWTGEARKIRIELPTMRKMRMVDVWEGKSGLLPVISS